MKKFICLFIIFSLTLFCAGCKQNYYKPDDQVSSSVKTKTEIQAITLNYSKTSLSIGETLSLIVGISPTNATSNSIKFKSTDEKVLSVNDKGVIFAKKEGTGTIIVSSADDEKVEAKCEVTVLPLREAIITGNVPMSAEADATYTVTVTFGNCINPSVKVIADCKSGKISGENDTISFGSKSFQYQVMGKTTITFSVSELKDINSLRILCFDNGNLIDSKEYNILISKKG